MLQTGTAQPHIYSKDLCDFNIPIPSLERQKEIVAYCEFNDALIRKLVMEIEKNKKEAKQFLKNVVRSQAQEEDEQSSEE
jgi:restriction endonuclease S subunit